MKFLPLKAQVIPSLAKGRWRDLFSTLKSKIQNPKFKTDGNALLISIFLSGIMLSVGIMAARLAVQESQMAADLFLSEKAYFSAESGVERALWELKTEPLSHIIASPGTVVTSVEDAHTEVVIRNKILPTADSDHKDSFSFSLPKLASQKFRFRYDDEDDALFTENNVTDAVNLTLTPPGKFFWRFLCQDTSAIPTTIALQTDTSDSSSTSQATQTSVSNINNLEGVDDDGNLHRFNTWAAADKSTCYLSVQNVSSTSTDCNVAGNDCVEFTFSGATMAPHAAHVHAKGLHQGREKHIRFDYAQKTLGSLFDFSFLHSKGGL